MRRKLVLLWVYLIISVHTESQEEYLEDVLEGFGLDDLDPSNIGYEGEEITRLNLGQKCNLPSCEIHDSIGGLVHLEDLRLSLNEISSLPDSFSKLINLKKLGLERNRLESLPDIFDLLPLEVLDISWNTLSSLPNSFSNLNNLKDLDLSKNCFKSLPEIFGSLPLLETLDANSNILESFPASLSDLKNLKDLDLSSNLFSSIPDIFDELLSLESLKLGQNDNSLSLPDSITLLDSLTSLNLFFGNFPSLPGEIGEMESLVNLNLQNIGLKSLPSSFTNLKNLEELNLRDNSLTSLPDFSNLEGLTRLLLNGNYLFSVPEVADGLEDLTMAINNNCINKCIPKSSYYGENIYTLPFNRLLCNDEHLEQVENSYNLDKCLKLLLEELYDSLSCHFSYTNCTLIEDLELDNPVEIFNDFIIPEGRIVTLKKESWFFNYGRNGFLDINGIIVVRHDDNDVATKQVIYKGLRYNELMSNTNVLVFYHNRFMKCEIEKINDEDEEFYLDFEDFDPDAHCDIVCTLDGFDFCNGTPIESEYKIEDHILIPKDVVVVVKNPKDWTVFIIDYGSIDIEEGAKLEMVFDTEEAYEEFLRNLDDDFEFRIIDGTYEGQFDIKIREDFERCEEVQPHSRSNPGNLNAIFSLDDSLCSSGLAWWIILLIVLGAMLFVVLLVVLVMFVKPVRYCIFPYRKRRDMRKNAKART